MKEVWKDVVGYEGYYEVSDQGRIKSLCWGEFVRKEPLILTPHPNSNGYPSVNLTLEKISKARVVHRLVAAAYLGESDLCVHHRDGDLLNNCVTNLEYITVRETAIRHHERMSCSSQYLGVTKGNYKGQWRANIYYRRLARFIGSYDCEEQAGIAYGHLLKFVDSSPEIFENELWEIKKENPRCQS